MIVKLDPASKDRMNAVLSVKPIYDYTDAVINKVLADKGAAFAETAKGIVFLPSSKMDLAKGEKLSIKESDFKGKGVHFWANANHGDRAKESMWIAYK